MSLTKPLVANQQPHAWEWQPPALVVDSSVLQNDWIELLATQVNCRIYKLAVQQQNDEVAAKSLRVKVVIDGETEQTALQSTANNTSRFFNFGPTTTPSLVGTEKSPNQYMEMDGLSVQVEVQFGDVPGTNQIVRGYIAWALLKETTVP